MASLTNEIKDKLDVVDVVGSYIKLEKAGQNFKARCPFHNEKTPSFFVSPKRGSFYCFGCGAKGDIFSFVEQFENIDFMGALKVLADRAGVKLRFDKASQQNRDEKERMFELMDKATSVFEENLASNKEALDYLKQRGLTDSTIKLWRLGFAENEWHSLEERLHGLGYSSAEMIACGLIKKGDSGKVYDVFRSRIIFPIFDGATRVIAFSGRIFGGDEKESAKYLNSPETALFKKSEVLYGFHRAKSGVRRLGFSILVEGQMDLLMSQQAGYDNTVATSGTAITREHVLMLKRLSPNLIIAYDNDSAGTKATLKAAELALSSDLHVKVLTINEGKDPADLIKADKELWKKAIKEARDIVTFTWQNIIAQDLPKDKLVSRFRATVIPLLAALPHESDRARLISDLKMSVHTGIREEYLMDDIHNYHKNIEQNDIVNSTIEKEHPPNSLPGDPMRRLFAILFALEDSSIKGIDVKIFKKGFEELVGESYGRLHDNFIKDRSRLVFEVENIYGDSIEENEIDELRKNVEEDDLREKLGQKMIALQKAEAEKNEKIISVLLSECQAISQRLAAIKHKTAKDSI